MRDIHMYSIIAGALFGAWPLLMNRSGVNGFASAAIFGGIGFLTILPVALASGQLQSIKLTPLLLFAVAGGLCGGLGVLAFNTALARVSQQEVGLMFIMMLMVQLAVPTVYHMIASGDYSPKRLLGILGAFVVAYLLA